MEKIPGELTWMIREKGDELGMRRGIGSVKDAKRTSIAITEVMSTFVHFKRKREYPFLTSYSLVPYYDLSGKFEYFTYLKARELGIESQPLPQEEKPRIENFDPLKIHLFDRVDIDKIPEFYTTFLKIAIGDDIEENREFESNTFRTGGSKIIPSIADHNLAN